MSGQLVVKTLVPWKRSCTQCGLRAMHLERALGCLCLCAQSVDQRVTLTVAGTPLERGEDGWRHCSWWPQSVISRKSSVRCGAGSGEGHTHPSPALALTSAGPSEESSHFPAKGT